MKLMLKTTFDLSRENTTAIDVRLERLLDAYAITSITLEEYQKAKGKAIAEKQLLKDKLTAFERKGISWFEPAIAFIREAETASTLAKSGDSRNIREFLEKIGSNFRLAARRLDFTYQNEWCLLSENKERFSWRRGRDSNPRYGFKTV